MKLYRYISCLTLICLLPTLSGCAAVAIGGAAAVGTASAIDRRTTGAQIEDQTIETKSYNAINKDAEIKEQAHINITSYNTVVLLTGETPTDAMRSRVEQIVKGVDKVGQIYNEITIAAPSSLTSRSSDTILTSKVKSKMLTNEKLNGISVKVVSEKGVVYLMGLVTKQEGEIATDIARQTGGAQKVVKLFQYTD